MEESGKIPFLDMEIEETDLFLRNYKSQQFTKKKIIKNYNLQEGCHAGRPRP